MRRSLKAVVVLLAMAAAQIFPAIGISRATAADLSRCEGERFDLVSARGGFSPYVALSINERKGAFLLDYGSTVSSLSESVFRRDAKAGRDVETEKFSLPSFPKARFTLSKYWATHQPPGGQLGVVGTDFLAQLTADFSFRGGGGGDVVIGAKPCNDLVPRLRRMTPVRQTGFFSSNPKSLRAGLPDVPVLFLKIGSVSTWAQIDTGYEDSRYRPAIDINEALYRKLASSGVRLTRIGQVGISTCEGVEQRQVYVAPTARLSLMADDNATILDLKDVKLVRKLPNGCGGIATMAEPAALLSVSIIARFDSVIFDPKNETVWFGRPQRRLFRMGANMSPIPILCPSSKSAIPPNAQNVSSAFQPTCVL